MRTARSKAGRERRGAGKRDRNDADAAKRVGGWGGAHFLAGDVDADERIERTQVVGERLRERLPGGLGGSSQARPRPTGGGEPLAGSGLARSGGIAGGDELPDSGALTVRGIDDTADFAGEIHWNGCLCHMIQTSWATAGTKTKFGLEES